MGKGNVAKSSVMRRIRWQAVRAFRVDSRRQGLPCQKKRPMASGQAWPGRPDHGAPRPAGRPGVTRDAAIRAAVRWALLLALGLGLTACTSTGARLIDGRQQIERPKYRIGVLPYPGLMSGLVMPDPDKLGEHSYVGFDGPLSSEQGRGLLYTCNAGFLDLAHVRKSADWSRYLAREVRGALERGAAGIVVNAEEPSRYHLGFRYPAFWGGLAPADRRALIGELSIRLGQHLSELANAWHEIISFYGYNSTVFLSEKPSAFTYDDMISHMLGVKVAAMAMRDATRDYDTAVTYHLKAELARLRVVSADDAGRAMFAVQGLWWKGGAGAIRRDLRYAVSGEAIVPWLVRGLTFCPDARPSAFALDDLKTVMGRDFTGFVDFAIEPNIPQARPIMAMFSPPPEMIRPAEHFPAIIARVRAALVRQYGADVDRPYPLAATQ